MLGRWAERPWLGAMVAEPDHEDDAPNDSGGASQHLQVLEGVCARMRVCVRFRMHVTCMVILSLRMIRENMTLVTNWTLPMAANRDLSYSGSSQVKYKKHASK